MSIGTIFLYKKKRGIRLGSQTIEDNGHIKTLATWQRIIESIGRNQRPLFRVYGAVATMPSLLTKWQPISKYSEQLLFTIEDPKA